MKNTLKIGDIARIHPEVAQKKHLPNRLQAWHNLEITDRMTFEQWVDYQSQNILSFIGQKKPAIVCIIKSPYLEAAAIAEEALRITQVTPDGKHY